MRIRVISTGGTIAKIYNEAEGSLSALSPVIERILARLRTPDIVTSFVHLLAKDSLDLTDQDRGMIVDAVQRSLQHCDAVLVIHGTDTLATTGDLLYRSLKNLRVPVVLTGAMRPFEFRDTDATQNVTEALLACRLIGPGVYVAMHNRILSFPGVAKDRDTLSFYKPDSAMAQDA